MKKLSKGFYLKPAIHLAKKFLGKFLVYKSPKGKVSGKIVDVEVYAARSGDDSAHGARRTKRTEVLFGEGGHAYVYFTYGMYFMFGVAVNKKEMPEVVFIRAVIPAEGIEIMKKNFGRPIKKAQEMTSGPGKLCKAFGITKDLYGVDLTGNILYIEDRGVRVKSSDIKTSARVGLNPKLASYSKEWRFYI
jgi:DNA-3-methyladenine glycosylase